MYKRLLTDRTLSALEQMGKDLPLLGTTPDDDLDVLCGLFWARRPKFALQLGTFYGYTALVLADIVKQLHGDTGLLVTVDNTLDYNRHCRAYAEYAGLNGILQAVDGYSTMLSPSLTSRPWDFIYLDTTHQYEQTRDELICLTPLCRPETVFCFHDASLVAAQELDMQQHGGVNRALREWVAHHPEWSCAVFEEPAFGHFGIGYMQRKVVM